MSKHTPGPWKWISADRGSLLVKGDESAFILQTAKKVENRNGIDTPDAALIAAAPDMLSALRDALNCIYEMSKGCEDPVDTGVISTIEAAIARADGK